MRALYSPAHIAALVAVLTACQPAPEAPASADGSAATLRIEVTHDASLHDGPLTGRLFLAFAPSDDLEPRIAAYNSARQRNGRVPFFSADVEGAAPGDAMVVDAGADGYPYRRLGSLPAGDYWVQAILHVYTEYERADGHTIWAPQDQWEGQRWAFSPGNYFSEARRVRVDPASDDVIQFTLTGEIPPIEVPPDTEWVKRVRIQSDILTEWWGHPMYLGAVVLLPRGFDDNPDMRYPLLIEESHFTLDPPFGFTTEPPSGEALFSQMRREAGGMRESGYEFAQAWMGEDMPRVVAVILQHPTPYFDDSYGVNSANNGPYGDAIHEELIPYIEENFRLIGEPYSRVMTGGSTGGWMSLAKMLHYPAYYGGTWTYYPDPIDFRRLPTSEHLRGRKRVHRGPIRYRARPSGCSSGASRGSRWAATARSASWKWRRARGAGGQGSWTPGTPCTVRPTTTAIRGGYGIWIRASSTARWRTTCATTGTTCATTPRRTGRGSGRIWWGRSASTTPRWTTSTCRMRST